MPPKGQESTDLQCSNRMDIFHLPVDNPDLMTVRHRPKTVKLAKNIHTPNCLIDNVSNETLAHQDLISRGKEKYSPSHAVRFLTSSSRQTLPTRISILTPLHPLTFRAPRNTIRRLGISPHIQIPISHLL